MEQRVARQSDLSRVLGWLSGEEACRMWAGPNLRVPATPETAWADIEATPENAYVLVDAASEVVAFGQVLPKGDHTAHLARLIVDPEARGRGIGRALCETLIDIGSGTHAATYFTLNVYASNRPAVRLYQRLGFSVKERDGAGVLAMARVLTVASV